MNLRQAVEIVLEALEHNTGEFRVEGAKNILREALAQPEQEPTAWRVEDDAGVLCHFFDKELLNYYNKQPYRITPLYPHPAPILEGWQLVPVEPTEEMINEADKHEHRFSDVIYRTMLHVAPKPGGV